MERKFELFKKNSLAHKNIVMMAPDSMYPQERDWTCAFACIRTMLSGVTEAVPAEDTLVKDFSLEPHPYYSKDIKELHILDEYEALYGCDNPEITFDDILDFGQKGYHVMLECMINYAHWMVLLGYFPLSGNDIEKSYLLFYDPYYNELKKINADEFISMWIDGNYENTKVVRDFIAVKRK